MRAVGFTVYLNKICDNYKIRYLKTSGIRNFYMQQISNYVVNNGYDTMLISTLSKHSLQVHNSHYDKVDIKEFCQRFYETEIGTVYLKGKVELENKYSKESIVEKGCGHCSLQKCRLFGKLGCFMCEDFITTLDCIPYYEKEIEIIDKTIKDTHIQHEKEFLFSKKKLLVAYLTELMKLESKVE